jgi:hypothetical protein
MPHRGQFALVVGFGVAALLTSGPWAAWADDEQTQQELRAPTIRLSLHPADEPRPALRYRLLPTLIDQRPGNAAVFYNKAALMLRQLPEADDDTRRASEWLDLPLEQLPRDEVAKAVRRWDSVLREVGYAAVRQDCDWQMPIREQFPYSIMLPELQEIRSPARMLALQARLAIAEGRFDDAVATLRTGYAVARHAGSGPTLIHALIGMAVGNVMTAQTRELAQQPGAPNLYWALADLPRPFIDLRLANDYEADSLYFWHPEWRDLEHGDRSPSEWHQIYETFVESIGQIESGRSEEANRWQVLALALKEYPRAKQWLVDRGRSPEAVDLMTVPQVVVLYTVGTYNEVRDQLFKWACLPYRDVRERLAAAQLSIEQAHEIVPLAKLQLPAVSAAMAAQARTQQAFTMQMTVEALRLYAARHNGQLPKELGDVTEVPLPDDPWTGKPFVYRLSGERATLEATPPPEMPRNYWNADFEITITQ